jgi:8-oxo-dGTP pyrophosphatase MutT (NUDIX family)
VHRRFLLETLERHLDARPEDHVRADHIRQFVRQHEDCLLRTCREGHVTGSAWIASPDGARAVLVHHRKLGRWLQPGGHADGEPRVHEVARREAKEETGLIDLTPIGIPLPLDVDVHRIPPHGDEPAHLHHDVRYLFVADPAAQPRASDESHDVRWFTLDEIERMTDEESVLRMARRAREILG